MEIIDIGTHIRLLHGPDNWDDIPKPLRITVNGNVLIFNTITGGQNTKATHTPVIRIADVTSPTFTDVEDLVAQILSWYGVDGIQLCIDKPIGDGAWENLGEADAIKTAGYTNLGLYIKQKYDAAVGVKIRVMLMSTDDPTTMYTMEDVDLFVKDLFTADTEIFYQFGLDGLVPYIQIQSYSTVKGTLDDSLTVHYTLK